MTTATPSGAPRDLTRVTLSVLGIGILITGTFFVMRPFIGGLLWATMIVVSTWPIMLRVQRALGGRRGAAVAVMTVALLLALFVPLYLALSTIVQRSDRVYELLHQLPTLRVPAPPEWVGHIPLVGQRAVRRWMALAAMEPQQLADTVAPYAKAGLLWFADKAGTFGGMLIQFLLTVIISAILYARGEAAAEGVRRFFRRLAGDRGDVIVSKTGKAIRAVAQGIVVTAVVQTVIAAAGLYGVGVPFAGFITAVVLVFCIAQLGPALVLLPCIVWLYASGQPGRGTALLVVAIVANTIDNVLRPVLIKRGADVSLLIIFPGVIGGLLWLGIIGLFIGPIVLAVTSTLVDGWITSGLEEEVPAPGSERTAAPAAAAGGAR